MLTSANYIARVGIPFAIPVHPGPPPEAEGTAAVIAIAVRNYNNDALADVTLYNNLHTALTAQIILAVNASFLSALEDPDFGFSNVTPLAMLIHLRREYYDTVTPEELERNSRGTLMVLSRTFGISNIQRIATLGHVPVPDITIITLTLAISIEKTGLLATTTEKFRLRPTDEWTVALFKSEFQLGN